MTEEPVDQVDEDRTDIRMGLTMHPENEVIMRPMALGLKPTIVIELLPVENDDDPLGVEVHVYGIGTDKDDVLAMGNLFAVLGMAIEEKAGSAYQESVKPDMEGSDPAYAEAVHNLMGDTDADDNDVARPEPEVGGPA